MKTTFPKHSQQDHYDAGAHHFKQYQSSHQKMTKLGQAGHNAKNSKEYSKLATESHQHKQAAEAHLTTARGMKKV